MNEGPARVEDSLPLSVALRVDDACLRFEAAWRTGAQPGIEDYLRDRTEPEYSVLLWQLLRLELEYREQRGEQPSLKEYRNRFVGQDDLVAAVFRRRERGGFPAQAIAAGPADILLASSQRDGLTPSGPEVPEGDVPWPSIPGYAILGQLGRGGMGVVYKARQLGLNRLVAVKMILCGGPAAATELARFRTEAEAIARLQHPNIVQIYEIGEQEGRPYFSLEFVEGGTLARRLAGIPLPPDEAARVTATLATAMAAAHQRGVVHRDLKPANVLLAGGAGTPVAHCVPKIADFGLAKQLDGETGQTHTGAILGTPSYMAPEQAEGRVKEVGPVTDVYALGAILYELLTGRPPFRGATLLETLEQVRKQEPVPPRQFNPAIDRNLEAICLKCLQKEPSQRYPSTLALAEDLQRFLNREPTQARPAEKAPSWTGRGVGVAAALGFVLGLVVAGAVLLLPTPNGTVGIGVRRDDLPKTLELGLGGDVELELVLIKEGQFRLGPSKAEQGQYLKLANSELQDGPKHPIEITKPFYLGKFEVTQEQYTRVTGKANPSYFCATGDGKEKVKGMDTRRLPVEAVSWDDAVAFCAVLQHKHGVQVPEALRKAGYRFRLPTEAQWEYACRAGTRTTFHFGDVLDGTQANCNGEAPWGAAAKGPYLGRTERVGSYPANDWGLYDMHGNVWEWCQDYYAADYYQTGPRRDPLNRKAADPESRVLRGGSWYHIAQECRAASRFRRAGSERNYTAGFRVALRADE
jgi:formylglycine-generating enzyme required for sulfatase activity